MAVKISIIFGEFKELVILVEASLAACYIEEGWVRQNFGELFSFIFGINSVEVVICPHCASKQTMRVLLSFGGNRSLQKV